MITINVCKSKTPYHPLITAMEGILLQPAGKELEIIMDDRAICKELKDYLIGKNIGFREIYNDTNIILQFTAK